MRNRRRLFALLAVTALAVSAVGTGGFSTTTADRGVTVDVVGDENAYMALEYKDKTVSEGTHSLVTATNQFAQDVSFTISANVEQSHTNLSVSVNGDISDENISPGDSTDLDVTLDCTNNETADRSATVSFSATADGDGVFATTSERRSVTYTVECSN